MTSRRRMSEKRAQAVADTATLVKAADWSDTNDWIVRDGDGTDLVVVTPAYSSARRRGWTYYLAATGPSRTSGGPWKTREDAAVQGLGAWIRWVTAPRRA